MSPHYLTKCIECDKVISEDKISVPSAVFLRSNGKDLVAWVTCQNCKIKIIDIHDAVKDLNDYIKRLDI